MIWPWPYVSKSEPAKKRALELAEKNCRDYPHNPEAAATCGWVLYRLGKLDEAERVFRPLADQKHLSLDARYYLACLANDRGRIDQAVDLLSRIAVCDEPFCMRRKPRHSTMEVAAESTPRTRGDKRRGSQEDGRYNAKSSSGQGTAPRGLQRRGNRKAGTPARPLPPPRSAPPCSLRPRCGATVAILVVQIVHHLAAHGDAHAADRRPLAGQDQQADHLEGHALRRFHHGRAVAAGQSVSALGFRPGRMRCRVISMRPKGLVRRISCGQVALPRREAPARRRGGASPCACR